MNTFGERYVRLVLAMGQHDADYVDAYYGPQEWRPTGEKRPLGDIDADAKALQMRLAAISPGGVDELVTLRHRYLTQQLSALRTRVAMLSGTRLTFDQESKALYDAVAPTRTRQDFERVLGDCAPGALHQLLDRSRVTLLGRPHLGRRVERLHGRATQRREGDVALGRETVRGAPLSLGEGGFLRCGGDGHWESGEVSGVR